MVLSVTVDYHDLNICLLLSSRVPAFHPPINGLSSAAATTAARRRIVASSSSASPGCARTCATRGGNRCTFRPMRHMLVCAPLDNAEGIACAIRPAPRGQTRKAQSAHQLLPIAGHRLLHLVGQAVLPMGGNTTQREKMENSREYLSGCQTRSLESNPAGPQDEKK